MEGSWSVATMRTGSGTHAPSRKASSYIVWTKEGVKEGSGCTDILKGAATLAGGEGEGEEHRTPGLVI